MKQIKTNSMVALTALAVTAAALFTVVPASAGNYKQADKTGASIAEFRDEIVTIKKEVDAALVALDKVVTTADADPRKAFKDFDKAMPRLESAAAKAKKRSDDMKAKGQDYFKQWEKELAQVTNPEIRALAEKRKAQLQAAFDNIKTTMEPAKEQFNPWLADMKDVQTYLSNDLTVGGIDAAKGMIEKSKSGGQKVQQSLDKVIAELNTIAAAVTPAKVEKDKKK
jgi:hypothetical protein